LENAWQASNGLRVSINETRNRQREQTITIANLVDHYIATELASAQVDAGKSHATKTIYRDFLTRTADLYRVNLLAGLGTHEVE
jgi:hypothetical protein